MLTWAYLQPKVGDQVDLRVVDASLASALFQGIPAARLLAHAKLARAERDRAEREREARERPKRERGNGTDEGGWEALMTKLLGAGTKIHERVRRAIARHERVAVDERPPKTPSDATVAVLVWAVACDPENDSSLAEIAPRAGDPSTCDADVELACAAFDDRLAMPQADKRAPAFEACVRLATRATLAPMPSSRFRAISVQLASAEIGLRLLVGAATSIFPRRDDDMIPPADRRMTVLDRSALEELLARDPRGLGAAVWRIEHADGGGNVQLATFLADVGRLLRQEGTVIATVAPPDRPEDAPAARAPEDTLSWAPPGADTGWTPSTAAALADALESGAMTPGRARATIARGGEAATDAIGAEMLRVGDHSLASSVFAEILARTARPRDILRLVTYFAMAPDPAPAARALGACEDSELPRVLKAWLEAMMPSERGEREDSEAAEDPSAARVAACIASLEPYPRLYRAVSDLVAR
jgi:hypothetical protein